jgi:hypothetical protein
MTEPTDPPAETPATRAAEQAEQRAEARAIRRRWITIGEGVAVAGVVIAGLTFWNSWQEREDAATQRAIDRQAERTAQTARRERVMLVTVAADDDGVRFAAQAACALQNTTVRFPKALGVGEQATVLDHRIETGWIDGPLLRLTDGGADRREGRLPVLIDARCIDDAGERHEAAIYDLIWRTEPGFLGGRRLRLRGLVRREGVSGDGQRRLDTLWTGP